MAKTFKNLQGGKRTSTEGREKLNRGSGLRFGTGQDSKAVPPHMIRKDSEKRGLDVRTKTWANRIFQRHATGSEMSELPWVLTEKGKEK